MPAACQGLFWLAVLLLLSAPQQCDSVLRVFVMTRMGAVVFDVPQGTGPATGVETLTFSQCTPRGLAVDACAGLAAWTCSSGEVQSVRFLDAGAASTPLTITDDRRKNGIIMRRERNAYYYAEYDTVGFRVLQTVMDSCVKYTEEVACAGLDACAWDAGACKYSSPGPVLSILSAVDFGGGIVMDADDIWITGTDDNDVGLVERGTPYKPSALTKHQGLVGYWGKKSTKTDVLVVGYPYTDPSLDSVYVPAIGATGSAILKVSKADMAKEAEEVVSGLPAMRRYSRTSIDSDASGGTAQPAFSVINGGSTLLYLDGAKVMRLKLDGSDPEVIYEGESWLRHGPMVVYDDCTTAAPDTPHPTTIVPDTEAPPTPAPPTPAAPTPAPAPATPHPATPPPGETGAPTTMEPLATIPSTPSPVSGVVPSSPPLPVTSEPAVPVVQPAPPPSDDSTTVVIAVVASVCGVVCIVCTAIIICCTRANSRKTAASAPYSQPFEQPRLMQEVHTEPGTPLLITAPVTPVTRELKVSCEALPPDFSDFESHRKAQSDAADALGVMRRLSSRNENRASPSDEAEQQRVQALRSVVGSEGAAEDVYHLWRVDQDSLRQQQQQQQHPQQHHQPQAPLPPRPQLRATASASTLPPLEGSPMTPASTLSGHSPARHRLRPSASVFALGERPSGHSEDNVSSVSMSAAPGMARASPLSMVSGSPLRPRTGEPPLPPRRPMRRTVSPNFQTAE